MAHKGQGFGKTWINQLDNVPTIKEETLLNSSTNPSESKRLPGIDLMA